MYGMFVSCCVITRTYYAGTYYSYLHNTIQAEIVWDKDCNIESVIAPVIDRLENHPSPPLLAPPLSQFELENHPPPPPIYICNIESAIAPVVDESFRIRSKIK
jgi:hypothetical protein